MGRRILVLVLAALLFTPALASAERVRRVPYDLAAPGPMTSVELPNPSGLHQGRAFRLGGTGVPVAPGEDLVEVYILDASTRRVPGRIAFFNGAGGQIAAEDFCFTGTFAIPEEATEVHVFVSTLLAPCPLDALNNGPGSRGEVLFSFT